MSRLMALSVVIGTFLYTTVGGLHEDSHADDAVPHEQCLVCLIISGSIDPQTPDLVPVVPVVEDEERLVEQNGVEGYPSIFWMVESARPPPSFG